MKFSLFVLTASGFTVVEIFGFLANQGGGISSLWVNSADPIFAILFLLLHGVMVPATSAYLLWLSERRVGSFLLLLLAAATIVPGVLMACGATLSLVLGEQITLLWYLPLAAAFAALTGWWVLTRRSNTVPSV
jgi:hypothetical protein